MQIYSDGYIDTWGDIFVKHDLRRLLRISFEQFLVSPFSFLTELEDARPEVADD